MKTSITQLIEYLKTLPPDTELSVVRGYDCGYSTCTEEVPLDLDPITGNVDFADYTGNKFVKPDSPLRNKKYLVFGET